ncbi:S8 family serine peptidase [Spongiactinospora sp. TRM90649]|uniref:S8 family serine peptidase n=1 Tax=Spongiactinospora sp. TRM90649 TaxID=3031114 RepID=UPI0023F79776|nr:S8 family serine peptidase [Spongiactinospora sp. TRM90649]MDF5753863.1 S8 family serine peptidase [Spongiactinospora sp. TRM90649]
MSHPAMHRTPRLPARTIAGIISIVAAIGLFAQQGAAHGAPFLEPGHDKIADAVLADLKDGKASFWVRLTDEADLTAAHRASGKVAKARAVYAAKTEHAKRSQAGLRELLAARHADNTPFWIVNAVKVTADAKLAEEIARLPEVAAVEPLRSVQAPAPEPAAALPRANAVEWNIDRINAPRVWDELGVRGEGIVVAHIDTGAAFEHPEIASRYRGRQPDGRIDHNYNWFDPAGACPTAAPCDNNDHGTHVAGTMVGQGGIGVAPGARWIAAKGCETNTCTDTSLLAAGQWILAPTDLSGRNPRPDLAPHIVNNSWGKPGFDRWYKTVVNAWVEAGIFPMFANGNEGPNCSTSATPGQYVESYSTGGFDVNNVVYNRSSKGAGENGEIKPNIAAPAVAVRSSVPGGYAGFTGTSMASPHVAATVALLWSAAPSLQGDVDATRRLLDGTAVDMPDTSCGGTAQDNNVFGEGRLDAYAAVRAAPAEPLGGLRGRVTSAGEPVGSASVVLTGPLSRTVATGEDGTFAVPRLTPGDYEITVTRFGYQGSAPASVTVADGQTATADVALDRLASGVVTGTVTTAGAPEAGATVTATGTPVSAVTDASGRYRLTLPHGSYDLAVAGTSRCASATTVQVVVAGDVTRDVELPLRGDNFGYTCASGAEPYVGGTERLALTGDDQSLAVTLPFQIPFYGAGQSRVQVATNGFASFGGASTANGNGTLPSTGTPNLAVYPFWDDLVVDETAGVYTATVGAAPHRSFVIEWRNVKYYDQTDQRITFSALLGEDGTIGYRYKDVDSVRDQGSSATIGIENAAGTDALLYSYNVPALTAGQSLTFAATRHGLVTGKVTDANDGDPLSGATVQIGQVATLTTGDDGTFYGQVPAGDHRVTVSKEHYATFGQDVTVTPRAVTRIDTALVTGRVGASTGELTVVAPPDATRKATLKLTNLGAATDYTVTAEAAQPGWLTVSPASGRLAKDESATVTATVVSTGITPGGLRAGKLVIRSASGRQPVIEVAVTVVVPKHQVAVDAGGSAAVTDAAGDVWTADRKYTAGGHGYLATKSGVHTTTRTIAGTTEQGLFRKVREGLLEYRFDNVPAGTYTVELGFAETRRKNMGERVFDVIVEGQLAIPALDLALEAGTFTAVTRQHTVRVTDGQLNVRFATRTGDTTVSFIRISERPDKAAR